MGFMDIDQESNFHGVHLHWDKPFFSAVISKQNLFVFLWNIFLVFEK